MGQAAIGANARSASLFAQSMKLRTSNASH